MKNQTEVVKILQNFEELFGSQTFTGVKVPDKNFEGNFLLIESSNRVYSFNPYDVLAEEELGGDRVKIVMRRGSAGLITTPYRVNDDITLLSYFESTPQTKPPSQMGTSSFATKEDVSSLELMQLPPRTLARVAAEWTPYDEDAPELSGSCDLGDREDDNCAHFLSNAFIRAGFTELLKINSQGRGIFGAWCDETPRTTPPTPPNNNARPIRAREMQRWFQTMAVRTRRDKPAQAGYWAVFQLDLDVYWGGHVLLYNSDADKIFGTGVYWNWREQYFYQW